MAMCMVSSPESLVNTIQAIPQAQKPNTKQYLSLQFISRPSQTNFEVFLWALPYSENPLFNEGNNVKVGQGKAVYRVMEHMQTMRMVGGVNTPCVKWDMTFNRQGVNETEVSGLTQVQALYILVDNRLSHQSHSESFTSYILEAMIILVITYVIKISALEALFLSAMMSPVMLTGQRFLVNIVPFTDHSEHFCCWLIMLPVDNVDIPNSQYQPDPLGYG
ncbi:hypothetical protein EDD85DRAFT_791048 [Armillaria nabsnona]|nr:hypothetical protein EDD85DRAFT_791048 [Armillaria nabsnona]